MSRSWISEPPDEKQNLVKNRVQILAQWLSRYDAPFGGRGLPPNFDVDFQRNTTPLLERWSGNRCNFVQNLLEQMSADGREDSWRLTLLKVYLEKVAERGCASEGLHAAKQHLRREGLAEADIGSALAGMKAALATVKFDGVLQARGKTKDKAIVLLSILDMKERGGVNLYREKNFCSKTLFINSENAPHAFSSKVPPHKQIILSLSNTDDGVTNNFQKSSWPFVPPEANRFHFDCKNATPYGRHLEKNSLSHLNSSSNILRIHGHGSIDSAGNYSPKELALILSRAGLKQCQVIELDMCDVGRTEEFSTKLMALLKEMGIEVAAIRAANGVVGIGENYQAVFDENDSVRPAASAYTTVFNPDFRDFLAENLTEITLESPSEENLTEITLESPSEESRC